MKLGRLGMCYRLVRLDGREIDGNGSDREVISGVRFRQGKDRRGEIINSGEFDEVEVCGEVE